MIYSSLDRLNAMHDLFTKQGNKHLDAGEVDALAGFYSGLPEASRKKLEARLADLYDHGAFAAGQRDRFLDLLLAGGMPKTALGLDDTLDVLVESAGKYSRKIEPKDIPQTARAKIKAEVKAWCKEREHQIETASGYDPDMDNVGVPSYEVVERDGKKGATLGYSVVIPVYQADHDVGTRLTFDLKGKLVDEAYIGE